MWQYTLLQSTWGRFMSSELATTNGGTLARSGRPMIVAKALEEETEQRRLLMQYVRQHMVEGTDFGVIPGTKNKTLLKPGAEKLTDLFRCVPEYEMVERVEDWDRPLIHYLFRCRIVSRDTGSVVAEGFGSCNSRESKYRYRTADRKCPECGSPSIMKSKFPPKDAPHLPPGWYCFAKKGGCGANFAHDDDGIIGQVQGKAENPDVADAANTILKMAKKRSQVDAVISLARCSDMFTQDVEDFTDPAHPESAVARPTPLTESQFTDLLTAKGWTWHKVLRTIDHSKGTSMAASKLTFEQVPADVLGEFAAWLSGEPDKKTAEVVA